MATMYSRTVSGDRGYPGSPNGGGGGAGGGGAAAGNNSTSPSANHGPTHVGFRVEEDYKERTKYLTAKYGQHQMKLIRKRLAVEDWVDRELRSLYDIESDTETYPCEIDLDELLDMDTESEQRIFLQDKVSDAKKTPEVVYITLADYPNSREGIRVSKPLRVQVLHAEDVRHYKNSANKDMSIVEAIIADDTGATKLNCYQKIAFPAIKEGRSVMMINFIGKPSEITVTSDSRVLLIPDVKVPDEIVAQARRLIDTIKAPTDTPILTVDKIEQLKENDKFTVIVRVTEVEEASEVTTRWNSRVLVRNGVCGDSTASICFAFWRELAAIPLSVGDVMEVLNGVLSSTSDGAPKITGSRFTKITKFINDLLEKAHTL